MPPQSQIEGQQVAYWSDLRRRGRCRFSAYGYQVEAPERRRLPGSRWPDKSDRPGDGGGAREHHAKAPDSAGKVEHNAQLLVGDVHSFCHDLATSRQTSGTTITHIKMRPRETHRIANQISQ